MGRPSLEVAGIFHRHGEDYRQTHHLSPQQQKAMEDIEACRTAHLEAMWTLATKRAAAT